VVVVAGLGLAACGDDDDTSTAASSGPSAGAGPRTVEIEMVDIAFKPGSVAVERGETVRFVFSNSGAATHDAVIGDQAAQDAHEEEMRAAGQADDGMGDMGHASTDEGGAITVEPGETGELTHTFSAGDQLLIGCHEPGHYDAGMKVSVDVAEG
jgi:uncharacterized cupredoxin-like copper-binding protein